MTITVDAEVDFETGVILVSKQVLDVVVDIPLIDIEIGVPGPQGPPGPPGEDGMSQEDADLRFVNTDGDTMTGPLILSDDADAGLKAVTWQQWVARNPKITVSSTPPPDPEVGEVWIDVT